DIASEDEDGFLTITDRLHRFSKIGGEMVPHIRVEETLHELAGISERALVVTAIPDPARGERLAVLHVLEEPQLQSLLEKLAKANLPNLWKPKPDHFIRVPSLPLLGSGKLDLRQAREIAARALAAT
ncbi:MAG: acyl-[ACP]--phospholipid O-acyltransferase, partial [Verrucomicrobiae bacterium]|nr:acyl-[ACP]--phospholipid O-acyltransferase [Verrucomicrobiae bacterium]